MSCVIAILGAGLATRFAMDKLSQQCFGKPLGQWSLDAALQTGLPVYWVGQQMAPCFIGDHCDYIANPEPAAGLSRSLQLAVTAAQSRNAERLMILLGDMPLIDVGFLSQMLAQSAPCATLYPDGKPGVPAIFPASSFDALRGLSEDAGARVLLKTMPQLTLLHCDADSLLDVDRPVDLKQAEQVLAKRLGRAFPNC